MRGRSPNETFRLLLLLIGVVVLTLFVAYNSETVVIDFVFWEKSVRLIFVLIATAIAGAIIASLLRRRPQ